MAQDQQPIIAPPAEAPVLDGVRILHPLDPLTAEEIRSAVRTVRAAHPELSGAAIALIVLRDPPKAAVVDFTGSGPIARLARVVVFDRSASSTYEADVTLATVAAGSPATADMPAQLTGWRHVPGVYPVVVSEMFEQVSKAALADERVIKALARRGFEDLTKVRLLAPPAGDYPPNRAGRNLGWGTCTLQENPGDSMFARPIEGIRVLVDLDSLEVIEVDDGPIIPVTEERGRFMEPADVGGWRDDIAPLDIVQPEGPGFTLKGNEIAWQDWRLHASLHPVDGLVLSHVRFQDADEERQILYRASLSEMIVPYGETDPNYYWRTYFDAGEFGFGRLSNALTLGCDCLGEIRYLDAVVSKSDGEPRRIPNAICIHEEDASILAKHTDEKARQYVRRARRLVISQISTVGNYDYGFYWSFYQDGTIELEIKLTGLVLTRGVIPGQTPRHANLVAPDLAAPHHQHLFCVRLDMAVDGFVNTVEERGLVLLEEGPDNPYGHATEIRSTMITRESEGQRAIDAAAARHWIVGQPQPAQPCRATSWLRLVSSQRSRAAGAPDFEPGPAGGVCDVAVVGDGLPSRRAACGRRLPQPAPRRRRATRIRSPGPGPGGHRRRVVAHARCVARRAAGGLAHHAGREDRFFTQARGLLRPFPCAPSASFGERP